jgi:hypothetical protein
MTMGSQLLVMDSCTYYSTITIQKHPSFRSRGTPMFAFGSFQFLFRFRRALSPYIIQEMLMADGSTSEALWTYIQHKDIPD